MSGRRGDGDGSDRSSSRRRFLGRGVLAAGAGIVAVFRGGRDARAGPGDSFVVLGENNIESTPTGFSNPKSFPSLFGQTQHGPGAIFSSTLPATEAYSITAGVVGLGMERGSFFFQGDRSPQAIPGPNSALTGFSPAGTAAYFQGRTALSTRGKLSFGGQSGLLIVEKGAASVTKTNVAHLGVSSLIFATPQTRVPGLHVEGVIIHVPERAFTVYLNEQAPAPYPVAWLKVN